jgi:hypothetical protein
MKDDNREEEQQEDETDAVKSESMLILLTLKSKPLAEMTPN